MFHLDSKLMQKLSSFADMIILNFCWLIGSLPFFTIGASTAAVYTTLHKMRTEKDTRIVKTFVSSWKSEFKPATIAFLLQTVFSVLLALNLCIFSFLRPADTFGTFMVILSIVWFIIVSGVGALFYPQLGRYQNSLFGYLKNALLLCFSNIWLTLAVLLILLIPVILTLLFKTQILRMGILWLTFGWSAVFYFSNLVISHIYKPIDMLLRDNDR